MNKNIIDISRSINNDALVYPGDDDISMSTLCEIEGGCPCKITKLDGWTSHFLTHVDAPRHFFLEGKTLDDIELGRFMGSTKVVKFDANIIDANFIKQVELGDCKNLLIKTRHSKGFVKGQFDENHVYISKDGAEEIVKREINLVGIDYLSVDKYGDEDYPAHRTLLGNEVIILEATNLEFADEGEYQLYALPLKIFEGDGSPVRAVLIK